MELKFIAKKILKISDFRTKRRLFKELLIKIKSFSKNELVKMIIVRALSTLLGNLVLKIIS